MAPGLKLTGTGTYNTSYTILRAHAAAYRLYDERYRPKYSGKVGISLNCDWAQPANPDSALDRAAADRFLQWYIGIWAHPILHGENLNFSKNFFFEIFYVIFSNRILR